MEKTFIKTLSEGSNNYYIDGLEFTYLSDVLAYYGESDFPDNILVNKVTTGCGMTSVVLSNSRKYVLCVPFVSLIQNKEKWCKENKINCLAVYGKEITINDIINSKADKIIVTYDSLGKVVEALKTRGDILEWKVCIDECHKLVDSGAVRGVLKNYKEFGSFILGTATPVKKEYQLPELKNIPELSIKWNNLTPVSVNFCNYEKELDKVIATLCLDYLEGAREGNAHIFINSVKFILSVLANLGSEFSDKINIVCSNTDRNQELIDRFNKNKVNYKISKVGDNIKKINFYTATAFEGSDIFDEDGISYIVTDGSRDYTKIDIMTILPQIIGRIRNSNNKDKVNLIYTANKYYSYTSEAEFSTSVKLTISKKEKAVAMFNLAKAAEDEETTALLLKGAIEDNFFLEEDGNLVINDTVWYNEMHSYSTLHQIYYVNKNTFGKKSGITEGTKTFNQIKYRYTNADKIEISELRKNKLKLRTNFKKLCKEYFEGDETIRAKIDLIEPFISKAYKIIGETRMTSLHLVKKFIERELIKLDLLSSSSQKIVQLLNLKVGQIIEKDKIKIRLQEIYDELGIIKKAKSTHLSEWFEIKEKSIQNKKTKQIDKILYIVNHKLTNNDSKN